MKVGETRVHGNCEIWKESRVNWMRYAYSLKRSMDMVAKDEQSSADSVDEWNYRHLRNYIEDLRQFVLEAGERLEGYAQKGENAHEG